MQVTLTDIVLQTEGSFSPAKDPALQVCWWRWHVGAGDPTFAPFLTPLPPFLSRQVSIHLVHKFENAPSCLAPATGSPRKWSGPVTLTSAASMEEVWALAFPLMAIFFWHALAFHPFSDMAWRVLFHLAVRRCRASR